MRLPIRSMGCEFSPAARATLDRRVARLEKRLAKFAPDIADLVVVMEREGRPAEYTGAVRLTVMNRPLIAKKNSAPRARSWLTQVFDDLEEQLDRYLANLRREPERRRAQRT